MGRALRVLSVYNRYVNRGGEDEVFESEVNLLLRHGCEVVAVTDRTRVPPTALERLRFAAGTVWSGQAKKRFRCLLSLTKPQVVHFYNTFPLFSPSVYYACHEADVPVVQVVQNYRLICPKATLYRDGSICEACVGKPIPWPGILHGCYHGSRSETAVVAAMLSLHRSLRTWRDRVSVYVAASEFSRRKLAEGGVPEDRIVVKPNFLDPDPGARSGAGEYALFVGRLSAEKGVPTLLEAWGSLPVVPLKIAGDGPLLARVEEAAARGGGTIEVLGRVERAEILTLMKGARFLVFPSRWYEGFPVTLVEALACGLPVVASRLGAMSEAVRESRSGLLFEPGDAGGLRRCAERLWESPREAEEMGRAAREDFETRYTAERNFEMLMAIYERARQHP